MDRRQAAVYRACFMRRRVTSAAASCSPATGPYRAHDTGCAGRHAGSPYQGQGPIELMGRCGERPLLGGRALPSVALPSVACGHARGALRRPKVLRGPPPRACSCCGWRQFDFPFGASMCLLSRFPSLRNGSGRPETVGDETVGGETGGGKTVGGETGSGETSRQ